MRRGEAAPRSALSTRRLLATLAGGAVLLLALAQAILPRIAASTISSRVARFGRVQSVSVSAWPAVKLLWGSIDSVSVHAGSLALSPAEATALLWEARGADRLDLSASSVQVGSLRVTRARLSKRGPSLTASAHVDQAQVSAALPAGFALRLLRSEAGQVEVQASGGLFGLGASVRAIAEASDGKLIARPVGSLLGAIRLTLLSNPHLYIEGVGASEQARRPPSYLLQMRARLR